MTYFKNSKYKILVTIDDYGRRRCSTTEYASPIPYCLTSYEVLIVNPENPFTREEYEQSK